MNTTGKKSEEPLPSEPEKCPALLGQSPAMQKIVRMVSKVAFTQHHVLILGPTGSGKELVARTIHRNGPNSHRPFLPVSCNTLAPETLERELFGYVHPAFPDAKSPGAGLLAEADGGTIFFDGVGELPPELQAKLVRVLQERVFRPLGAKEPVPLKTRILASSDDDASELSKGGKLRRDLYFRLNVVNITLPPLSERREDIHLLGEHILRRIREKTGIAYELSSESEDMLLAYEWPGNVRELEGALERACLMANTSFVTPYDFATQIQQNSFAQKTTADGHTLTVPKSLRVTPIAELEKDAILNTIQQLQGDKVKAARLLGIGKTTLYRKLKEYGIPA